MGKEEKKKYILVISEGGERDLHKVATTWTNKMSNIARFRFTAGLAAGIGINMMASHNVWRNQEN